MKKIVVDILKFLVPLLLSASLVGWLLRTVNLRAVEKIIQTEVNYWILLPVMIIVTLSHVIRGFRWKIQLSAAGVTGIPNMTLITSIFGAYAMNIIVPFVGEGWRVLYIARRGRVPISTVLGTDIGDRISDAAVVLTLTLLSIFVGHRYIISFIYHYAVTQQISAILSLWQIWVVIGALLLIIIAILIFDKRSSMISRIREWLLNVWRGFAVLFTMKGRGLYLILTIGIWTCFYLETYLSFYAFPFTRSLISEPGLAFGLLPGLIAFVFSSLSMLIPSNGGLGPWNIATMFGLSLFGVSTADGTAFSLIVWSTVTLTLVILGIYTIIYASRTRTRTQLKK